jgi:hypothetical protein
LFVVHGYYCIDLPLDPEWHIWLGQRIVYPPPLNSPADTNCPLITRSTALTPIGDNVTFVCTNFQSDHKTFIVLDEVRQLVLQEEDDVEELSDRGIFESFSKNNSVLTLDVFATETNNNTRVLCRDLLVPSPPKFSATLNVTVIGQRSTFDLLDPSYSSLVCRSSPPPSSSHHHGQCRGTDLGMGGTFYLA